MRIVLPLRVDPEHAPARQQQSGQDPPNELPIQPPRPHPPAHDLHSVGFVEGSARTEANSVKVMFALDQLHSLVEAKTSALPDRLAPVKVA
jgi:hypothetical protein